MNIVKFDGENGIEIFIDQETGESFCSISGYARMSGKNRSTIFRRFNALERSPVRTIKIPTEGGAQTGYLVDENLISNWLPHDNPEAASMLLKMGIRMSLHKWAKYEYKAIAPEPVPAPAALTDEAKVCWTLEVVQQTKDLLAELGGLDERTKMGLGNMVKSAVLKDQWALPSGNADSHYLISVSDRLQIIHKLRLSNEELSAIGQAMDAQYRLLHPGKEIPTRKQYVGGAIRAVKCYTPQDWDDFGDSLLFSYLRNKGYITAEAADP